MQIKIYKNKQDKTSEANYVQARMKSSLWALVCVCVCVCECMCVRESMMGAITS
jgi:hypothetical protein